MTIAQLSEFNQILNIFNNISKNGINESSKRWILENLPKSLPFFTHLISFEIIERITINRNILKLNKRN